MLGNNAPLVNQYHEKKHPQNLWISLCKTAVSIAKMQTLLHRQTDCVKYAQKRGRRIQDEKNPRGYFSTRSRLLKSSVHVRNPAGTGISVATLRMGSASKSLRFAETKTWSVLAVQ